KSPGGSSTPLLWYGMYDAPMDASPSSNSPRCALLTGAAAAMATAVSNAGFPAKILRNGG
ncbi:MAG TPA: hypothetical protein VGO18_19305, partial [Steroidobacteraceae bacterium]|nr:hypothetical protein [Steroidobacteraceae bacterium]